MDWSWVPQVLAWIVAVNNTISNFAAVLGFLTLLAAGATYMIRQLFRDPFGAKRPKGPRYKKFFESLVTRVGNRDKTLTSPDEIGAGASCPFETDVKGIEYCAHFIGQRDHRGQFAVYVDLGSAENGKVYRGLEQQRKDLDKEFAKRCRDKKQQLSWESPDTNHNTYRIAVYYPEGATIDVDAKKLKQIRKWAARRLVAFRSTFDQRVPGAAALAPADALQFELESVGAVRTG